VASPFSHFLLFLLRFGFVLFFSIPFWSR
jgi:hypothetical protein